MTEEVACSFTISIGPVVLMVKMLLYLYLKQLAQLKKLHTKSFCKVQGSREFKVFQEVPSQLSPFCPIWTENFVFISINGSVTFL